MTTVNPAVPTGHHVRVVARVRPLAKYELEKNCQSVVQKVPNASKNEPEVLQINNGGSGGPESESTKWFELDAVLDEQCSQQQVYEQSGAYRAISQDLFGGYNCTILAYGQTGAGKVSAKRMRCQALLVSALVVTKLVFILSRIDLYDGHGRQERGTN